MTKSRRRKNQERDRSCNFLPPQSCIGFERSLSNLVNELVQRAGTDQETDTSSFACEYLADEIFSKYLDTKKISPSARRAAAIHKWLAVEDRNAGTNVRIMFHHDTDFGWTTSDKIFDLTRKYVARVLGTYRMETVFTDGSHTNGASTRVQRSEIAAIQKHGGEAHVSTSACRYWYTFASGTRLSDQPLAIQESSVMFTVDKSSEIDRVACKEPEINMLLQRCVGSHIRKRLRRFGINLNDQSINRNLAKSACRLGLATIDLSSASDSISLELVRNLLPYEWFEALDDIRVKSTIIDGETHSLNMFSSMGNGFTFELESLLFWCLTRAVAYYSNVQGRISVYGDDIICPRGIGPRLARFFHFLGFRVNDKKSYWSGPFRESCGGHYHNGIDVTPFYLRGPVRRKTDVIRVLNQLLKWDSDSFDLERGKPSFTRQIVSDFHRKWSRLVPTNLHGGRDVESINSLVTGTLPRDRILQRTEAVSFDQSLGLTYWLTVKEYMNDILYCDPSHEVGYYVTEQVPWCERTTWNLDQYLT